MRCSVLHETCENEVLHARLPLDDLWGADLPQATVIEAQDGSQMILGVIDVDTRSGVNRYMSAGMRTRIGYGHQVQGARENASESLNRQMESTA